MTKEICQFLQDPHCTSGWSPKRWSNLIQQGYANRSLAQIAELISQYQLMGSIPPDLHWHINAARTYHESHKHGVVQEIHALYRALGFAQITPILLKGAAYLAAGLNVGKGRVFSDIDAAVKREQLTPAEQSLHWHGWSNMNKDDYDQHYYRVWMHELPPFVNGESGGVLDLHHTIVPPISGRAPALRDFSTQQVEFEGLTLTTFTPAAMLLHSAVHLMFEEDFSKGFRDISDIHLLASEFTELDDFWSELKEQAQTTGFEREIGLALRYSQYFFATKIPIKYSTWFNKHLPSRLMLWVYDILFTELLKPVDCLTTKSRIASYTALIRGHLKKMPLHVLLYHTWHKITVSRTKKEKE